MTTYRELELAVLREFSITREELYDRARPRNLFYARMVLANLAMKHTDLSLHQIGRKINRHNSTVLGNQRRCTEIVGVAIKYLSIQESMGLLE